MKIKRSILPVILTAIATPALMGARGGCGGPVYLGELEPPQGTGSTPGTSSPADPNPVSWDTGNVKLTASDFQLVVDGKTYYVDSASLELSGDPGDKYYTSLELRWSEYGREMRLFMYLYADDSTWWSEEIRTYDGQPSAEWIYYYGSFFNMPLGVPFTGDLTLKNNGPEDTVSGTLTFRNMNLLPTFNPWIYSY